MSQLTDTLAAIKDEHLTLEQCEKYRDTLIHIKTSLHGEIAEYKKRRAIWLSESDIKGVEASKMAYDATGDGQRLIELKGMMGGLGGEIDALQSRIYGHLRLNG